MTDKEILETIETCVGYRDCIGCPHCDGTGEFGCDTLTIEMVFGLAIRQKDEIEGLIVAQETLQKYILQLNKELERANARGAKNDR